jgi:hypothetical protein
VVKVSLRAALTGLWLLIVVICLALAVLMAGLFQLGVGAEIRSVQAEVLRAGRAMQQRFDVYLASYNPPPKAFTDEQRRRELELIVQLVLGDYKGVEGGFWSERGGFVAYAFPTYEGETPKKDVPQAEAGRIAKVAADALESHRALERRFDGETESLILCARPVGDAGQSLVAWTMSRAHVSAGAAYRAQERRIVGQPRMEHGENLAPFRWVFSTQASSFPSLPLAISSNLTRNLPL